MAVLLLAMQSPHDVTITLPDNTIETSRIALAVIVVVFGAVIASAWWLIAWIIDLPGRVARAARNLQARRANQTIAEGLLAAEGGDALAAARATARLPRSLPTGQGLRRLGMLLRARALEASENWIEAERAFSDLAGEKGGELAGLRGLAAAAVKRGDYRTAIYHSQSALKLRTQAAWPFQSLFDLQVRSAEWLQAVETLAEGERRHLIDAERAKRRRAVLHAAEGFRLRLASPPEAEKCALEAIKNAPAFPPAALLAARLAMAAGRGGRAQTLLEAAWKARPHPALALAYADLKPGEEQRPQARRLRTLADLNPEHRESRILVGEAAIAEGDWLAAAEALAPLLEEAASSRLCTLMEAVARGQGSHDDARRWGKLAASAPREADWSDIDPDGRAFDFDDASWSRLVFAYGDQGKLIHPRYEAYGRELEALSRVALPAPAVGQLAAPSSDRGSPTPGRRRGPTSQPTPRPVRPPAPDYAPED